MIDRATKLRWRRQLKKHQRQIEDIGYQTEENIDKHFFRRLGRLYQVRRFILTWVFLLVSLILGTVLQTRALGNFYLALGPTDGGLYSEGMIGSYTNSNPIFASNEVNSTVSRLIFSGLFSYDKNNKLIGDMAESFKLDDTGKVYTVKLKPNLKWHDGKALTSRDVEFTIKMIQNPDTRSPYFSAWQGIKIATPSKDEVVFTLPNVLASFPYSLTLGILPEHKLRDTKPGELRSSQFNTIEPVGSGPFRWKGVEVVGDTAEKREQRIDLVAYSDYHQGRPKIDEFIVRAFLNEDQLVKTFKEGKINAIAGALSTPLEGDDVKELNIPLSGSVMAFFNNDSANLSDAKVRRALTMATNRRDLVRQLRYSSILVDSPLLPEQTGSSKEVVEYGYDKAQAEALLNEAGWVINPENGLRTKDGKTLDIRLKTLSSAEYATVANQLQKQWKEVGVSLSIESLSQDDLQNNIDNRDYDALIYGILMGQDADQFAYWHSSQADVLSQRRFNFSNYKSDTVDEALSAGRTRIDPKLREAKYLPFLQAWREDAPAIALYRPRFIYTVYGSLYNFDESGINTPVDRFDNVQDWMIRSKRSKILDL